MSAPVLLLSGDDLAKLLSPTDYLVAVERGFRASKDGRAFSPAPMHVPANHGGGFHAKGARLDDGRCYVALKLNGNFPGNPERAGLPTIQGALLLCDGDNGAVLAILDSIEVTVRRTAAASALAARHLALADASTLALIGCGGQALAQAQAIAAVRQIKSVTAWDIDTDKARRFAAQASETLSLPVVAATTLRDATAYADIIVTATTAFRPILDRSDVKPGAFIAAVGADHPHKSEISPALMGASAVVVDKLDQCLTMGDLHHAVDAGVMTSEDVRAALCDIISGQSIGRMSDDEVIVFDSTGTAIQDVASAALAYERAVARGGGVQFALA